LKFRRKEIAMAAFAVVLICRLIFEVVRSAVRATRKAKPQPVCLNCVFAHVQYAADGRIAISCTFGGVVRPMKLDVVYCTDFRDRNRPVEKPPIGFAVGS
jgi:hypothetical protein